MPQFILKIDLGNDCMNSDGDIARALFDAAGLIRDDGILLNSSKKRILDVNGNTVGHYEVVS
jgi:hypothetical protein